MRPLNECAVLVTGAAGGIGRACVRAFLAAGARVVGTDATDATDSPAETSDRYRFIPTDLRDERSVERMVIGAASSFGSLDALVNNAAIFRPMAPAHETTAEQFDAL